MAILFEFLFIPIAIIGGYIGWKKFLWWPYEVLIYEPRQNGWFTRRDRAKRFKSKGKDYFKLKKLKKVIQPFMFEHIQGANIIVTYRSGVDDFYPMKPAMLTKVVKMKNTKTGEITEEEIPDPFFVPIPESRKFFGTVYRREVERRTMDLSKIEKYLPMVALIVTIIVFAVAVLLIANGMEGVAEQIANAASALANAKCNVAVPIA